jgi:hypothetical protein
MKSFTPELKKILREAGYRLVRYGKGDHEIWESPTGGHVVVDGNIKSRHSANGVLKQAGLPKQF